MYKIFRLTLNNYRWIFYLSSCSTSQLQNVHIQYLTSQSQFLLLYILKCNESIYSPSPDGHLIYLWSFQFNPISPITDSSPDYRSQPSFEHKTHCVIFVVSAKTIHAGIPPAYVQKIKQLQDKVRRERKFLL